VKALIISPCHRAEAPSHLASDAAGKTRGPGGSGRS